MKTISEIISQSRRAAGMNQSELARALGITPQSVQAWESGRARPRPALFPKIAEVLRISPRPLIDSVLYEQDQNSGFLVSSDKATPEELAELAEYESALKKPSFDGVSLPYIKEVIKGDGSGGASVEKTEWQVYSFSRSALAKAGVTPRYAACIDVSGNSMDPLLQDGSIVCIDTASTGIVDGKVYALDHAGQIRIRVLYRLPGGGMRMRSFNREEHSDEEYDQVGMEKQKIRVLGRVFWSSTFW